MLQICNTDGILLLLAQEVVCMTTGERIKARRKELGITADKVAEQIGVSRSTMFRYEKGEIEKIPINNLVPIARALHTTVGYLMGWSDEKNSIPVAEDGADAEAMHYFDRLSEDKKVEALNYLRYLASNEDKK